jgi:peptidyl-prolyl cis-trans isomerase C
MGIFDAFNKAFVNEKYSSPPEGVKASARHILVKSLDDVDVVMNELKEGVDFGTVARRFSQCPSSSQGGSLGSFRPGTMVAEFDNVIFSSPEKSPIGQVVGPVQTQFGYHILVVDKRTGV